MSRKKPKSRVSGSAGEDADLWRRVARTVAPLDPQKRGSGVRILAADPALPEMPDASSPSPAKLRYHLPPVNPSGPRASSLPLPHLSHGRAPGLDFRTHKRMSRGKLPVDRRIDLHGMSREQARMALTGFLLRARDHGCRCVLVITGKGVQGRGVLRAEVPVWLNAPDLRPFVLGFDHARPNDGGEGALYVLLRRNRDRSGGSTGK